MNDILRKPSQEFGTFIDGGKVSVADYNFHLNRYCFGAQFVRGERCLDIGCGTGYGSSYLAKKGARSVIAGDYSEDAIAYAKQSLKVNHTDSVDFQIINATSLPFKDNSFDVVVSFEIIEHLKNYPDFVHEIQRVLRKNGTLIISTPNRQAGPYFFTTSWNHHHHEFTPVELIYIMKEEFDNIQIYGQLLLNKRQLVLKRMTQTVGRSLEVMRLNPLKAWLGKTLLPHTRLMVYHPTDIENFIGNTTAVVPLEKRMTPVSLVITAKKR